MAINVVVTSRLTCAGGEEDGEQDGEGGGDVGDDLALAAVARLVLADAVAGCCVLVEDVLCATDGRGEGVIKQTSAALHYHACRQYSAEPVVVVADKCLLHHSLTRFDTYREKHLTLCREFPALRALCY